MRITWTVYMVTINHQKKKLQKEYKEYWNAKTANDGIDGFVTPFIRDK